MSTEIIIMVLWVIFVFGLMVLDARLIRRDRDKWRTIAENYMRRETVRRRVFKDFS